MDDNQLKVAVDFAKRGLRIFPQSRKKIPCIKEWPKKASNDPEIIRGWAKEFSSCNFAFAQERAAIV